MKKKFYIFLSMLLGVILLLIIQRALVAIYIIIGDVYPAYDLLTSLQLHIVNIATAVLAVLAGMLYGNYLGHHWYPLVYGDKALKAARADKTGGNMEPHQKTVTVKPVRSVRAKVTLRSETKDEGWDFDDLINHDMPAVESLSSAAPSVASAVSLGELAKRPAVRKAKPAVKPKTVKKASVKKAVKAAEKPAKAPARKTVAKKKPAKAKAN